MRTPVNKIILLSLILLISPSKDLFAGPTRFECLVKLGNSATKEQLDACVSGGGNSSAGSKNSVIDTNSEEANCTEMGFKKRTEAYANCVLELIERKENAVASNDPDDATCTKYGFKRKSNDYAKCRMQIDFARQEAQQIRAREAEQQRQYQEQLNEYERQRKTQASIALMQLGFGMMASGSRGYDSYGTAPVAPTLSLPTPRTYILPGGRTMTCTTTGSLTNCF